MYIFSTSPNVSVNSINWSHKASYFVSLSMFGFMLMQRRLLLLLNQSSVLHQWSHWVFGSWGVWSRQVDVYECLKWDVVHHQQWKANLKAQWSVPSGVAIMLVMTMGNRPTISNYWLSDSSPVESPLCWWRQWEIDQISVVLDSQILPQWSHHYVGVPMFWPDWQDQKMRQHQNHFGARGSSPPGPGEGSLQ